MFKFNRNEQLVLLMLSLALFVGMVVSYLDRNNSDTIPDFDVKKGAVPVPDLPEEAPTHTQIKLDVNTATAKDFEALPGVGPQIAQRIVAYRTRVGKFATLEDLTNVSGIGPKTLERLRPQLTISAP